MPCLADPTATSLLLCHPRACTQFQCWQRAFVTPYIVTCSANCRQHDWCLLQSKDLFGQGIEMNVQRFLGICCYHKDIFERPWYWTSCLTSKLLIQLIVPVQKKVSDVLSSKLQDHKELLDHVNITTLKCESLEHIAQSRGGWPIWGSIQGQVGWSNLVYCRLDAHGRVFGTWWSLDLFQHKSFYNSMTLTMDSPEFSPTAVRRSRHRFTL